MWWWVTTWVLLLVAAGGYLAVRAWGLWGQTKELGSELAAAQRRLDEVQASWTCSGSESAPRSSWPSSPIRPPPASSGTGRELPADMRDTSVGPHPARLGQTRRLRSGTPRVSRSHHREGFSPMIRNLLDGPHLVILILVVVVVFGWKRLPDAARGLGRSMRIFKSEVEEMAKARPRPVPRAVTPSRARLSTRPQTRQQTRSRSRPPPRLRARPIARSTTSRRPEPPAAKGLLSPEHLRIH